MDLNRALRSVVSTGKVFLGSDETLRAIDQGQAKLVILASNNPQGERILEASRGKTVPVFAFQGKGTDLGPACGKPFPVGALTVTDPGESDIMQLAREAV